MFQDPNARVRVVHPDDLEKPEVEQRYITLRRFLSPSQRAEVKDAAASVDINGKDHKVTLALFQLTLLRKSMTGWGGPGFPKFGEEHFELMDDEDPLVKESVKKCIELWSKNNTDDPKE